jgi:hypothetical protein
MSPSEKQAREDFKKIYNSETSDYDKVRITANLIDALEAKGANKSKDDEKLILELMEKKLNFERAMQKTDKDRDDKYEEIKNSLEEAKARLK